ncbi:TSUP family transporter [Streptomyces sp. NPDC056656]|uniref:TSUP family transporter n=1 Tax=Streptomyces sp. NPDC056656 TaxID=3345895 RepID=UPI0036B3BA16
MGQNPMSPLDGAAFGHVSPAALLFLCAAAFLAGAVDAIVGGGGLIQLPAMIMIMPGGSLIYSLATNKIVGAVGTSAAVCTYARKTTMDWAAIVRMSAATFPAAVAGASCASALPAGVLSVVVLVSLVLIVGYTLSKPDLGVADAPRFERRTQLVVMVLGGAAIGFWDGLGPPGTGSLLVFLLVGLMGYSFLGASATSKVVNVATNAGALVFFIPAGKVLWGLGLLMAVSNLAGGVTGASLAVRRGTAFVRRVFIAVVGTLIISVGIKFLV